MFGSIYYAPARLSRQLLCATKNVKNGLYNAVNININDEQCQSFHSSWPLNKAEDRKSMLASMPKVEEGVEGEKSFDLDMGRISKDAMFPDENTPDLMFNGVRFADLPVLHIHVSKNNTIMSLTNSRGNIQTTHSCGAEGFKNTRKGTNVAAQATGISFALRAQRKFNYKTIRLVVKGLGPGRMASVKGLQMGGMDIVSISDRTPVPKKGPRPRKQRKL